MLTVMIAAYHGFGQHFLLLTAAQMTMYLKVLS